MAKDKIFKCLGSTNHLKEGEERASRDFYATPQDAVIRLLDKLKELNIELPNNIIEPSVGNGNIANILTENGYTITAFDIVDRGYPGTIVKDFLTLDTRPEEPIAIIANFPYKDIVQHVEKSLSLLNKGEYLICLTKIQFLESKKRYESIFKLNPPKYCFVFVKRVTCLKNNKEQDESGAVCYTWSVFEKGFKGAPSIYWIDNIA